MHWAKEIAAKILETRKSFVINTGITPSGEIHIGNMREVLTADAIYRALCALQTKATFNYIADSFDPLRRVYPFLDDSYANHIGKPLSSIPCPCKKHANYSEHFLIPFLESLETLDVKCNILYADKLYKSGAYNKAILESLKNRDKIAQILFEETGRKVEAFWSPFNPICKSCGKMNNTKVLSFDEAKETVTYECACGSKEEIEVAGNGKLTWRVDWPARWNILNVSVEPFGKDHASKGGSFDTGTRIVKEIFKSTPPFPIVYEWISLKGKGDMSSSKGNVISIADMLKAVPPEVLRYMIFRVDPKKSIGFDPSLPLLNLINEYDDINNPNRNEEGFILAQITNKPTSPVPFNHMVNVVQIAQDKLEKIKEILVRNNYNIEHEDIIKERANYARSWLDKYAPEDIKFKVQDKIPENANSLNEKQKTALKTLADRLQEAQTPEQIHELIYKLKEEFSIEPKEIFEAIYISILGKRNGPKVGFFLKSLDSTFVKERFKEISKT
jgi:lysyl-tRNA synthetase class 1